ncbi:hypothetical protein PybrP1_007915 [[Pythium] brassicae (nom. inval.)]|nr:hypothetical protein PybrP1_007915 [[Pythium] brassicae (nom. inval.)]
MDAEWELVERSKSVDALAARVATRADMETAKREGNAYFERRLFADAVRKYSLVIDWCLLQRAAHKGDLGAGLTELVGAVRLNRALAHIEQQEFSVAEEDCSAVLRVQPGCIKALYRRALAREQLGNAQGALHDIEVLLQSEPTNPAALSLLERVRSLEPSDEDPSASYVPDVTTGAWRALQDEERQVRQVFKAKKPPRVPAPKKSRQIVSASGSAEVAPASARSRANQCEQSIAFRCKTHEMWESLAQEELRTVAKVFAKRRGCEPQCES